MPNARVAEPPHENLEWRQTFVDRLKTFHKAGQATEELDAADWVERHFYAQEPSPGLIQLQPHQGPILRFLFQTDPETGLFKYRTLIYSTIKKSGKTAIAGAIAQWAAEDEQTWGRRAEIYAAANDFEQAQGRIYQAARSSVEDTPGFEENWKTGDRRMVCRRTGSVIKPISTDYKGESGANPSLTVWSELWAYTSVNAGRLWDEMKPSPARRVSVRFVETYRGFTGESTLLENLETLAIKQGRQITAGELQAITGAPLDAFEECSEPDDLVPLYVNEAAQVAAYIDEGLEARRMPWQTPAYYEEQERTETPATFERHHMNRWQTSESQAFPEEWWDACIDPMPLDPEDKTTPLVGALDAGVTHDGFALQLVSRHPTVKGHVAQRHFELWLPQGGAIDYKPIKEEIKRLSKQHLIIQWAYDPYQLHQMTTELRREGTGYIRDFSQGRARTEADRDLLNAIRDRTIHLLGDAPTREHALNANKKEQSDEDSRMRFVKRSPDGLIDLLVALSMASFECLILNTE